MSFRRLVLAVSLLAVFAIGLQPAADTDTFWHLAAGRWMVEQRQVLQHDVFSHTRVGESWVNHSWLSQLVLYAVSRAIGTPGLSLMTALLAVAAFALLWSALEGPVLLRGFVTVLAASAAAIFWSARPQMMTFTAAAAFVVILERWRLGRSGPLWALPAVMLLWANLHGGFAIGFLLMLAYLAGSWLDPVLKSLADGGPLASGWGQGWRRVRPLAGAIGLSLVAACANPVGPRLLAVPLETVSIGALRDHIQEWQSPNFHQPQVLPFAAMLLLTATALATSRDNRHPTELLLFAGLGYLALSSARNISLFALVLAPTLCRHGQSAVEPLANRLRSRSELPANMTRPLNLTLSVLLLVAVGLWSAPRLTEAFNQSQVEQRLPVAAVDYMETTAIAPELFNSYDWGGYLIWRRWPTTKVFVDGRTDLYGDELLQAYLEAWRAGPTWRQVLNRYQINSALLEPTAPLVAALQAAGWQVAYRDPQAVLLTRPSPGGG